MLSSACVSVGCSAWLGLLQLAGLADCGPRALGVGKRCQWLTWVAEG